MSNERPLQSVVGLQPPPRKGDRLFGPYDDGQNNACMNYMHNPEYLYSNGYRTAAQLLADRVCETGRDQDSLVYPIVYLYRHHCEMVLKSISVEAFELLDRQLSQPETDALDRHGLFKLWENLRPLLNAVCKLVGNALFPEEDLEGIEAYIRQIHEHDPDGQRFRYATAFRRDKKKKTKERIPSLRPELKYINIRVFAKAMKILAEYLECIDSWFGNLLQTKYDALYESAY